MKTTKYNKGVKKVALCMALGCFLLFFMGGNLVAQNDPQFVIKKGDNYLAHVRVGENYVLQNADRFNPATCLWYSGNTANVYGLHHNYYFIDHSDNYRFLAAPLQASGQLSLSATLPSIQLLRNTDQIYYFYDWDPDTYGAGVARGHKYTGVDYSGCTHSWHWFDEEHHELGGECWEVYWVEYDNGTWELSAATSYNIPTNGARYRSVSITEHDEEISGITSGLLPELADFTMEFNTSYDPSISIPSSVTAGSYTPAYTTYVFEGGTHNYYGGVDHGTVVPSATEYSGNYVSLEWTITGDGAYYLSFDEGEYEVNSSSSTTPTIYYKRTNTTGHHTATLTLVVTYRDNDGNLATQERTATISLRSECINPGQPANPVVTYEGVTVSWYPTASQYRVYLTTDPDTWTDFVEVEDVNSYTFTGLAYNTQYYYKVVAYCDDEYDLSDAISFEFKTKGEAGLLVYGAIYGGGRMANVGGKTEVVVINCDSVHAVYGGNDIAGTVQGVDGATITLGVNTGDAYATYGTTNRGIRINDVYGGGNGYYAYNGTSFVPASYDTEYTIAPDASILDLTTNQQLGDVVWTNTTGENKDLVCPTIKKTAITVNNDYVKIDSLFGGAKNAILKETGTDVDIKIHGGTVFTVYGGNNYGGSLGYHAHEHILVTNTTTKAGEHYHQDGTLGRDFGIGYLFGGGNKVQGQHVDITVEGGQIDTIFGGGNAADVRSTVVRMQCALGAFNETTGAYGKVYTEALNSTYSSGDLTNDVIDTDYKWDRSGIYNVRTLFGGNNRASMEGVPSLLLTSGSIGTVYGGGNEGDMLAQEETTVLAPNTYGNDPVSMNVKYSTHVQMNSPNILVDFLYGGCQKSNVDYSTLTEIMNGHVGTVYGGCNVSGDVGSTRVNPNVPSSPASEAYQEVQGGTYVKASGGVVHGSLFGGSNGFYHCNNGISYIEGVNYCPSENYVGLTIPTHNETHVMVTGDAMIKKNVYAGGNMSPVGFTDATVGDRSFPQFVGLASVRMDGGEVVGNVFGGGNMASILGGNEVIVSGGSIGMTDDYDGALYGGNDRSGQVGQISNRVFPVTYDVASDGHTSLTDVNTYVSLTGKPFINTVYGGGNGDYDYVDGDDVIPAGDYCSYDDETGEFNDKPIQTNTFVDINITGNDNDGHEGGHINTVYGGGNGVTVYGSITVFLNVVEPESYDHVGTIFGGNNKDNVVEFENVPLVPDIILLHGQVGTVYGGCNRGAMTTGKDFTIGGKTYQNVGSMVRLRSSYQATSTAPVVPPDAVVSHAVYGGCRMTDVYYNSLVLVESGEHPATVYGGSDISGTVGGTSQVVVTGGSIGGDVYGGGNGHYDYSSDYPGLTAPYCSKTYVEVSGGTCSSNVFGGGYAGECGETYVLVDGGTVNSKVFGGGNEAGVTIVDTNPDPDVTENSSGNSTVNMNSGFVGLGVFGGCNSQGGIEGNVAMNFTGGTIGTAEARAEVHGGGYGQPTTVAGDVLINFGEDTDGTHNENLNLYGDLYGGSALGNVNTDDENTTTIHIDNGTIHGNTYGGGLGDKASLGALHTDVEAKVFGKVYVIVGGTDGAATPTFFGKASFDNGSIFGCNNLNGSPQANVFVDVYQTNHTEKDKVDYIAPDRKYAIYQLFGGGNKADYAPENGSALSSCSTNVYIHGCQNTIEDVFGGSNAANSNSAHTIVEGGRFDFIFGGGNGLVSPANVGTNGAIHHTYSRIEGGRVGWCFGGSNRQGNCINIEQDLETVGSCGELIIDYFFQGGNQADQYGEMLLTLDCSEAKKYLAAYGGCRLGSVYGNITVIMTGGTIGSLFGGNQGDEDHPAHVKRFPTEDELTAHPDAYSQELKDFIDTQYELGTDWRGKGGNITVIVKGGAVGNLYGGCDTKGNVDGKITVIVESEDNSCGLFVGNVYGASNHTEYYPENSDGISPKVNIIKATVGGSYDFNETPGIQPEEIFEGNVFGGGNVGEVKSNPKVTIGDGTTNKPVTIKGSVYGGGNDGNVVGNPQVLVDPDTHTLSVVSDHGTVTVGSNAQSSSYAVGEDVDINIVATANPRYAFSYWEVAGNGASVGKTTLANTILTMGTENATLTAHYTSAQKLTIVADPAAGGTFKVNGVVYTEPIYVAPGTSVTVVASPAAGYNFNGWTVTGEGSIVTDPTITTTHFTMGSADATLKATFTEGRAYNDMNSNR